MRYIFDLSNIQNQDLINEALVDWQVTRHSPRCFEAVGRAWEPIDLVRIWVAIGQGGHVFVFDLQSGKEYSRRKIAQVAGRSLRVPDDVLDIQTLQFLAQFEQPDMPL
jgi:hypothetical protein